MSEKRNQEDNNNKINSQKAMRKLKCHAEKRMSALAVTRKIAKASQNDENGDNGIQSNEKKIFNPCPF